MQSAFAGLVSRIGRGNPGVTAAMVVDAEGRVHASATVAPEMIRAAVSFVVRLRRCIDGAASELGYGMLRGTLIEGSGATFALADVDGNQTAVLIGASGSSPGALRADSLWLADELRRAQESS